MKIVYCIASTYNSGGKDRVVSSKANYLVELGHKVVIITTDQKGRPAYFGLDQRVVQIDLGLNYEDYNNLSLFKRLKKRCQLQQRHTILLRDILRELEPDIVLSTFEEDAPVLAKLHLDCPKIMELHYSKERRYNEYQRGRFSLGRLLDWWRTKEDERIVSCFDYLVALTDTDRRLWTTAKRSTTIPNPLPFGLPAKVSSLVKPKVLAVGRLSSEKNFGELIDIWASLGDKASNWQLEIVGGGYQKRMLEEKITTYGLQGRVRLHPPTSDIVEKYQEASILAMTSKYEGFGMVLIEAMSCGLPVIAYDCPYGPREIIKDYENGALIPMHDQGLYAERLESLMQNAELRIRQGQKARQSADTYAMPQIMSRWLRLFEELNTATKR